MTLSRLLAVMAVAGLLQPTSAQGPSLSTRDVLALATESPAAFERTWEARVEAAGTDASGEARAERRAARARGYIDYTYFRWRETGETTPAAWPARRRAVAAVDVNDATALDRREHHAFLDAWLRAEARARLASDASLATGDNRWLRARFAVVEAQVREPLVRRRLLRDALTQHIDENGARGVPELIDRYAALTGASRDDVDRLRRAAAEALAPAAGDRVEIYKKAGGVALEAHVFAPAGTAGARPGLLWFHGGSWASGAWSHCPTVCRAARDAGYVVIQIEYRTDDRFASGPLAAIADARDALAWARTRAADLGVDPARLMVAGFSSGGTIAALLATTSPAAHLRGGILMSACLAPSHDGWFLRMTEGRIPQRDITPAAQIDAADPAMLAVHGDADEMCPYADTAAFVDAARAAQAAGTGSELLTLPGATHFFPFRSPDARTRAAQAVTQFLERRR